jgi:3-phosphoshikimate 1-carboxyvinyltransferase
MSETPDKASARAIIPAKSPLDATVRVPGSKSITNRALLLAALAGGRSVLRGALDAEDTQAFAGGLRSLGVPVDTGEAEAWLVTGAAGRLPAGEADVF